jgi:hypothetical protein
VWFAPYKWRRGARVSWLSLKTKVDGLSVVWTQNHSDSFWQFGLKTCSTVSSGLASKPAAAVFSGLVSKPVATVFSSLASKPVATIFSSLASKPVVGFLVEPQNEGGGGFPGLGDSFLVWASKPYRFWFVGCATKSMKGGQRRTRIKI